jgi:hypothetical protein
VLGQVSVGGERRVVARGAAGAVRPGRLRVTLLFKRALRRKLENGLPVSIRFTLLQGQSSATREIRLQWDGGR